MPYKIEKPYQKLPREKSRRVKIPKSLHPLIKYWVLSGLSIRKVSYILGVSRRLIQFIVFPERHEKNLNDRAARGGSAQYYDKEKNTKAIRECRRHRQKEIGIIKESK